MSMTKNSLAALSLLLCGHAMACDLQFSSGGSSLVNTGPPGTTQIIASYQAVNVGSTACLPSASGGSTSYPGLVAQAAINPANQNVNGQSYSPFEFVAVSDGGTSALECGNTGGSVACVFSRVDPGQQIGLDLELSANQIVPPPFCLQAASYGLGARPSTYPTGPVTINFLASQGFDQLRACAGSSGGGGGNPLLIAVKDDVIDPVQLGDTVEYRITVTTQDAGVFQPRFVDILPVGLTYLGFSGPAGWSCSESPVQTVTCQAFGSVPAGTVSVITLLARADQVGTVVNTCTAVAPGGSGPPVDDSQCTESTTITPPSADLSITKSDSVDPVVARGAFAYTLSVTNSGPASASDVVVIDTVPADVLIQSVSGSGWTCGVLGQVVTCSRPSLSVATLDIQIQVLAPAEGGLIQNRATVVASTGDSDPGNNEALEPTTVLPQIDLDVVKTGPGTSVRLGQSFDYDLLLSNTGPSTATGVSLVDTLPAGVSLVSTVGTGWSCTGTTTLNCALASSVAAGASAPTLTVRGRAIAVGPTTNTCVASSTAGVDPNGQPSCIEAVVITPPEADLGFAKTDVTDPVPAGGIIRYVISGTNLGPDEAPSVEVVDSLPTGTTWLSATGAGWNCNHSAGVVTCTRGATPVGAVPDLVIEVRAPDVPGIIENTCVVQSPGAVDPTPADEACEESTTVEPLADLEIAKTDSVDPVSAADSFSYTLQVNNLGPSVVSGTVTVVDTLPAGVVFQSANGAGWSCTSNLQEVLCTRTGAALGAQPPIQIDVIAPTEAGSISNTAVVSAEVDDPQPGNNTDTEGTQVAAAAGLSISKSDSADPVQAGSTISYLLTVRNAGPSTVSNAVVSDSPPSGVQFLSAAAPDWTCSAVAALVTCTRPSFPVGTSIIEIQVRAPSEGGTVNNIATVTSDTPDPEAGDDRDEETTTILPVVDLDVVKLGPITPVRVGQTFEYRLTLSNAGPSTATQITLIDALPAEVAYVAAVGTGWTCSLFGAELRCAYSGSVPAGGSAPELVVTVRAAAPGKVVNTCTAQAQVPDADGQPNCQVQTLVEPPLVDLEVIKTTSTPVVPVGGTLVYTLAVSNRGPDVAPAGSVRLVDTLPTGTTLLTAGGSGWSCGMVGADLECVYGPALAVGATATISVQARAPDVSGQIENTCIAESVGALDPEPNSCSVINTVQEQADLVMDKTDVADPVAAGAPIGYVLQVRNDGPSAVSGLVTVTDTLPPGPVDVVASGEGWTCTLTASTLTCTRPSMALGSAPPIAVQATAPAVAGQVLNQARVDGPAEVPDPNPGNNADTETTAITALSGLSIIKSDSRDPVDAGSGFSYFLDVINAGPSEVLDARIEDTLPSGLSVEAIRGGDWSCAHASGQVICNRAVLPVGSSRVEVDVRAPSEAQVLVNTASVLSSTPDPDLGDNSDEEDTTVLAVANIDVVKAGPTAPVVVGQTFNYTLIVRNAGPSTAQSVRVIDTLPSLVQFQSFEGASWSCTAVALEVRCNLTDALAAGAEAPPLQINVLALQAGLAINTCIAELDGVDPDGQPSCRTETTIEPADYNLSVQVTDDVDPVGAGQAFQYIVEASNTGDTALTQVRIEGRAAGVEVAELTTRDAAVRCEDEVCSVDRLEPGATMSYAVSVVAPMVNTPLSYEVLGFADEPESVLADNADLEPTTMLGPSLSPTPIPVRSPLSLALLLCCVTGTGLVLLRRSPR